MKILIMSDSHGDSYSCRMAVKRHSDADFLIHLGDGVGDIDATWPEIRKMKLVFVRGNCSYFGDAQLKYLLNVGGKRLYCCHGHIENVKHSLDGLTAAAKANGCDAALYGHTHVPDFHRDGDLVVLNPGAIRSGRYAVLEISDSGDLAAQLMEL